MNVEFTSEEATLLTELVEERIATLGPEIHHTDHRAYREGLKNMREKLVKLFDHLSAGVRT